MGVLMVTAHPKSTPDAFSGAREQMRAMEEHLRSDAAFASDLAELERYVKEEGRELERRLLQAHLDLRAAQERPVEVCGADGLSFYHYDRISAILEMVIDDYIE